MIERERIDSIDDVPVTITVRRLRFILSKMEDSQREACKNEDAYFREKDRWIKEYARTGKVAEFDKAATEASLIGHKDQCTVWEGDELFSGLKCNCGFWEI